MTIPKPEELARACEVAVTFPRMPKAVVTIEDGVAVFRADNGSLLGFMNAADYETLKAERAKR